MRITVLLVAWSCVIASGQPGNEWERIGDLRINRVHATWKSPESLVADLQSTDRAARLDALRLAGAESNEGYLAEVAPNEVELRYASLDAPQTKQAIVLFESLSYVYAAVAVPSLDGWERIAVFECWCKYEGSTFLDDVVRVEYGHAGAELVARASGGGTGIYRQTEARFALRNERLEPLLSFTRRERSCPAGTDSCSYQLRSFVGGELIEAKATFGNQVTVDWDLVSLRNSKPPACTPYKWDAVNFKYTPSGPAHPCKYEPPK
jgi:hypothetical protein